MKKDNLNRDREDRMNNSVLYCLSCDVVIRIRVWILTCPDYVEIRKIACGVQIDQ